MKIVFLIISIAVILFSCEESIVKSQSISTVDSLLLHRLKFKSDYDAGVDVNGIFRGGTELNGFIARLTFGSVALPSNSVCCDHITCF
jgi:hypothetical protein